MIVTSTIRSPRCSPFAMPMPRTRKRFPAAVPGGIFTVTFRSGASRCRSRAPGTERRALVLHPPRLGELLHHLLLLLGELLGHDDRHLDDQVAAMLALRDAHAAHAEALSGGGAGRDLHRHLPIWSLPMS